MLRFAAQLIASAIALVVVHGVLFSLPLAMLPWISRRPTLAHLIALACGFGAARVVWRLTAPRDPNEPDDRAGLLRAMLSNAALVGGICFAAGFFGPLVLAPGANQGPLLGIFITGPLGAVLGAIIGAVRWNRESRQNRVSSCPP